MTVAANVFTDPEIATVGVSQQQVESGRVAADVVKLDLATNARAKMSLLRRGFVKIFCRPATGVVIGGVVVAPIASELILPIALAVQNRISVTDLAQTLSVYPSLSGSIVEAARRLDPQSTACQQNKTSHDSNDDFIFHKRVSRLTIQS